MPVLIVAAYDENGKPNVMNAAWGGIYSDNMVGICLSEGHKTTQNILKTKAFTVSVGTADQLTACDYVGLVSLECELVSYDMESNFMVGKIVNVSADECIVDEGGKINVARLQPVIYDPCNHDYLAIGSKVGKAFSEGNKLK